MQQKLPLSITYIFIIAKRQKVRGKNRYSHVKTFFTKIKRLKVGVGIRTHTSKIWDNFFRLPSKMDKSCQFPE